jgi:hypothetical protein
VKLHVAMLFGVHANKIINFVAKINKSEVSMCWSVRACGMKLAPTGEIIN